MFLSLMFVLEFVVSLSLLLSICFLHAFFFKLLCFCVSQEGVLPKINVQLIRLGVLPLKEKKLSFSCVSSSFSSFLFDSFFFLFSFLLCPPFFFFPVSFLVFLLFLLIKIVMCRVLTTLFIFIFFSWKGFL